MTKPAPTPTEIPLVFTVAAVPATIRTAPPKDNAFTAPVTGLVAAWDEAEGRSTEAITVTVPVTSVEKYRRLITRAGAETGKSMRVVVKPVEGDAANVTLTFWAVNKITRARKGTSSADIAAA